MNFSIEPKEIKYTVDRLSIDVVGIEGNEVVIHYALYSENVTVEERIKKFPLELLQIIAKKPEDIDINTLNQMVLSQWELVATTLIT